MMCASSQKYTTSIEFVEKFERECGSQASVKRLRTHPSYNIFMAKWNLPVYFQIRWIYVIFTSPQTFMRSLQFCSVNPGVFRKEENLPGEFFVRCCWKLLVASWKFQNL